MTTAARPTWAPAKGSDEQGGSRMFGPRQQYSARDMASHTSLKHRTEGQGTKEEIRKRDLRAELDEKEQRHFAATKDRSGVGAGGGQQRKLIEERLIPRAVDADDSDGEEAKNEEENEDSDEDDDEDDTAALLAELERIKKERAEEKAKKEREQAEADKKAKDADIALGNPLLSTGSFNVKKRWDDDVVFRNQAKGEVKVAKRFINDTIRSDFHRKFLNKYMK